MKKRDTCLGNGIVLLEAIQHGVDIQQYFEMFVQRGRIPLLAVLLQIEIDSNPDISM